MVDAVDVGRLERDGWSPLPALDAKVLDALRVAADEIDIALVKQIGPTKRDLEQLLPDADLALRRSGNDRLRALLGPLLARWFPRHRAVAFNVIVKRAGREAVPMHRDFALVDERRGDAALQLWIPLCDVDDEGGALAIAERSHVDAPSMRCVGSTDEKKTVERTTTMPLRAGEGVVFSNRTIHGSAANRTAHARTAVGAIVVPRHVSLAHWIDRGAKRELWAIGDDDLIALSPAGLPPSARLIEVIDGVEGA
jgi:hypothetical protein